MSRSKRLEDELEARHRAAAADRDTIEKAVAAREAAQKRERQMATKALLLARRVRELRTQLYGADLASTMSLLSPAVPPPPFDQLPCFSAHARSLVRRMRLPL